MALFLIMYLLLTFTYLQVQIVVQLLDKFLTTSRLVIHKTFEMKDKNLGQFLQSDATRCFNLHDNSMNKIYVKIISNSDIASWWI